MPACKLNPEQTACILDPNIYWDGLNAASKERCKQDRPCGPLIDQQALAAFERQMAQRIRALLRRNTANQDPGVPNKGNPNKNSNEPGPVKGGRRRTQRKRKATRRRRGRKGTRRG